MVIQFSGPVTKILSQNFNKKYLYILKIIVYLNSKNKTHMTTQIKSKKITNIKNGGIRGYVKLTDKTTTHFEITSDGEWEQWGNSKENLCLTVPLIEKLQQMILCDC